MKKEIDFEKIPYDYLMCMNNDCPKSSTCLRHLAGLHIQQTAPSMHIINPQWYAELSVRCRFHRPSEKGRYAQGFTRMLESLPKKTFDAVTLKLKRAFNGRNYYRVRKGERLLSSAEQLKVRNILRSEGITNIPEFDAYVEEYAW